MTVTPTQFTDQELETLWEALTDRQENWQDGLNKTTDPETQELFRTAIANQQGLINKCIELMSPEWRKSHD